MTRQPDGRGLRARRNARALARLATTVAVCLLSAAGAMGQMVPAPPELDVDGGGKGPSAAETRDLDLVEKLGDSVPLDAPLIDETGQTVRLGDYFQADRPVILNLGYYGCPMLCGQMIRGLGTSLRELEDRDGWVPGQDYEVVTISFDSTEGPAMAGEAKQQALRMLQDDRAGEGWHFLTGDAAQVREIANAVGFPYLWSDRA
ncbi:MAG: SCO family protein, partial [Phycisphaeraceae bacterium]